jgi:fucose permease
MTQHGIILLLVGPMVPNLMRTFEIGESMAGVLLGMGSLGFVLGPLIAGSVIDRFSARESLLIGLVVELATFVLFGLSPIFVLAVAANFLMHLGASFVETTANVVPTLIRSTRSAHSVMNLVHMFFSVGAFAGPFLIGLYLESTGQWRPILFFTLIPTFGLLVWTLRVRFPRRPQRSEPHARGTLLSNLSQVLRMRHAVLGSVSLLLYVGAEVGVSSWVVYYLQRQLGLSPAASAAGLSMLWIFIMVGRYANSILGNRFSSVFLVTVSGVAGAAGVLVFLLARSAVAAYAVLAWIGLCLSGVFPNIMAELNNRDPEHIGTVTAVMAMGAALGAGIFQWFVGFLAETVSLTVAFITPAALQLLYVVTFALAAGRDSWHVRGHPHVQRHTGAQP